MDKAEYFIDDYKVEKWCNPMYNGNDREKKWHPALKMNYKGIVRV